MLDQIQTATAIPFLSALLEFPDFQEGLRDGQQSFQEGVFCEDHEKRWNEDDIIQFLGEELSESQYRRGQCIDRVMGYSSASYLHHLGFAISYLD